jgi:hypothetical protein
MHGPINVKSPNNTNKWQMGFNSAFKGLNKPNGDDSPQSKGKKLQVNVKVKSTLEQVMKAHRKCSTLSLTLAIDEG